MHDCDSVKFCCFGNKILATESGIYNWYHTKSERVGGRGEERNSEWKLCADFESMLQVFCIVIGAFTTNCLAARSVPDFFWLLYGVVCGHS